MFGWESSMYSMTVCKETQYELGIIILNVVFSRFSFKIHVKAQVFVPDAPTCKQLFINNLNNAIKWPVFVLFALFLMYTVFKMSHLLFLTLIGFWGSPRRIWLPYSNTFIRNCHSPPANTQTIYIFNQTTNLLYIAYDYKHTHIKAWGGFLCFR